MANKVFLAYWDCLGFESILDCSAYEKHLTWSALKGEKPTMRLPIQMMLFRAQANPQRFPEIWTFNSEIDLKELIKYSKECPQVLADAIRKHGSKVFVTPRNKELIK